MGLYTLRRGQRASPLHKFGNIRDFGAVTYPVPLQHGQTWKGQFKFRHKGPAETIRVVMGPYVAGVSNLRYVNMSVGEDAVEKEYTTPEIYGPFNSGGLSNGRTVDTNMHIRSADGSQTYASDSSTNRFKVVSLARSFNITQDRYANPVGWAAWAVT